MYPTDEKRWMRRIKNFCKAVWKNTRKALAFVLRPVVELMSPIFTPLFRIGYYVGAITMVMVNRIKRRAIEWSKSLLRELRRYLRKFRRWAKKQYGAVAREAEGLRKHMEKLRNTSRKDLEDRVEVAPEAATPWEKFRSYIRAVRANKAEAKRVLNYVLPGVCFVIFLSVLSWGNSLTFALQVTVRDQFVGYIENEAVFETADKSLQKRIVYNDGEDVVYNIPVFSVAVVSEDQINTANEVCDNMIAASGEEFIEATGLYVDGNLIGATTNGTELKEYLQAQLDAQTTGEPNEEVSFQKDVETVDGLYLSGSVIPYEELYEKISGNAMEQVVYTVVEGDTPSGIASSNGMTMAELYALNTDTMDSPEAVLHVGQQLTLQRAQPYLAVQVTRTISYTEEIAYETEEVDDSNYYVGKEQVTQNGKNGEAVVTAKVTYVEGIEVASTLVSREVTTEPVNEVIHVGTKVAVSSGGGSIDISSAQATGSYVWPVQGGAYNYVSCEMYGYYGHTGMDIAAPHGTAIVAVDSGVVTVATQMYMNGLYIVINHGNGIETMYCHCSQLLVSPGQTVSKGQLIARVGMTGNASGNHLHIEFRKNGVLQNPRAYLGY